MSAVCCTGDGGTFAETHWVIKCTTDTSVGAQEISWWSLKSFLLYGILSIHLEGSQRFHTYPTGATDHKLGPLELHWESFEIFNNMWIENLGVEVSVNCSPAHEIQQHKTKLLHWLSVIVSIPSKAVPVLCDICNCSRFDNAHTNKTCNVEMGTFIGFRGHDLACICMHHASQGVPQQKLLWLMMEKWKSPWRPGHGVVFQYASIHIWGDKHL